MTDSPIAADRDGIRYLSGAIPAADDVRALYDAVRWSASTGTWTRSWAGCRARPPW